MVKQASKIQEKGTLGRLNVRARERAAEGRKREVRLMLISLIDTFIILCVFLFQNFSAEGDIMEMARIAELKRQIARLDESRAFTGEVIIQGDKNITFELLKRVMYTVGRAEYGEIRLAVLKNR